MRNLLFRKARILFVIDNCFACRIWKEIIESVNTLLPLDKRISIIYCTKFNLYGTHDNPLIRTFDKYIQAYPVLFFEGEKKEGSNSRAEVESWLMTRVRKDLIVYREIPYLFNQECYYKKNWYGRKRLVCS